MTAKEYASLSKDDRASFQLGILYYFTRQLDLKTKKTNDADAARFSKFLKDKFLGGGEGDRSEMILAGLELREAARNPKRQNTAAYKIYIAKAHQLYEEQ